MKLFTTLYRINPFLASNFEGKLFNLASRHIKEYDGGKWYGKNIGGSDICMLPGKKASDTFTLENSDNYSKSTVNRETASAALTLMALNHFIWSMYDSDESTTVERLVELVEHMRCNLYASNKLDTNAITNFLD